MKKNKKIWSYALAGALAVSNLSVVAAPFGSIVAQAASYAEEAYFYETKDSTATISSLVVPKGQVGSAWVQLELEEDTSENIRYRLVDVTPGVTVKFSDFTIEDVSGRQVLKFDAKRGGEDNSEPAAVTTGKHYMELQVQQRQSSQSTLIGAGVVQYQTLPLM